MAASLDPYHYRTSAKKEDEGISDLTLPPDDEICSGGSRGGGVVWHQISSKSLRRFGRSSSSKLPFQAKNSVFELPHVFFRVEGRHCLRRLKFLQHVDPVQGQLHAKFQQNRSSGSGDIVAQSSRYACLLPSLDVAAVSHAPSRLQGPRRCPLQKTGRGRIAITLATWTRVLAGTQEKRQVHREPI